MTYKDIQDALATLNRLSVELEDQYIESEGEVTEATEEMEARKAAVQDLLQNDGIDALGRWLKTKEDEVKMWKAEKAAADRKVKSAQNTVDFVKAKIAEVMVMTGRAHTIPSPSTSARSPPSIRTRWTGSILT